MIREDGHVIGLEVIESASHRILDKDVLAVVKQASPLKLKHPLGQLQVIVQVPISYKLE